MMTLFVPGGEYLRLEPAKPCSSEGLGPDFPDSLHHLSQAKAIAAKSG
jgi:hypothetical protein